MTAFRLKSMRRRYVALVTTVTTVMACTVIATGPPASAQSAVTAKPAAPAQAATAAKLAAATKLAAELRPTAFMEPAQLSSGTFICLTNADQYCLGANIPVEDIINNTLELAAILVAIWGIKKTTTKPPPPDQNDPEDEIVVEGESDDDTAAGDCLADTGGYAFLTTCGADGTVWIVIPHSDGYYLESRYLLDNGDPGQVLTVDPVDNGASVYCFNE